MSREKKGWSLVLLGLLLAVAAAGLGYATLYLDLAGIYLGAGVIGLVMVGICMIDPAASLMINLAFSFSAAHLSRWLTHDAFPVGVVSDVLIYATLLGYLIRRVPLGPTFRSFVHSPVVVFFLVYLGFGLLEAFNINARSTSGWFVGIRKMTSTYMLLFIAYEVFKDKQQIWRFIRFTFWGCVVLGLYACVQQAVGLFGFERDWVMSDDIRFGLIFIDGDFRKFSMLSSPMIFGLLMAAMVVFYFIVSIPEKGRAAWVTRLGLLPMLLGMLYSGTRTANFIMVVGLGLYILLTIDKKGSRILAGIAVFFMLFVLYVPIYTNATLNRFRSTFQGTQDQSYLVRETNRHYIQPYIWSHPIGGGLCTTGEAGRQYNPGHYLAGFPTDNDYLTKALETGWIGLILIFWLYFLVMRTGIRAYFQVTDPREKYLAAAITCCLFCYYVASYTQIALGSLSDIVIYYPFIAILVRLTEPARPSS
ncbi:O-antigen ligase family protein [Dinghuibacter silviterrae]|nr:O-antigen ligase family protein [Dinghuibacter silviterrae]